MKQILAFVNHSATASRVSAVAALFADRLDAELDLVTIGEANDVDPTVRLVRGEVVPTMLAEIAECKPALTVIGERGVPFTSEPIGDIAKQLLTRSVVPVMVVPPNAPASFGVSTEERPLRVLVPLDGTRETDEAVVGLVEQLAAVDVELLAVHVLDQSSIPGSIDTAHDVNVLASEFGLLHIPVAKRIALRLGDPARHILDYIASAQDDGRAHRRRRRRLGAEPGAGSGPRREAASPRGRHPGHSLPGLLNRHIGPEAGSADFDFAQGMRQPSQTGRRRFGPTRSRQGRGCRPRGRRGLNVHR